MFNNPIRRVIALKDSLALTETQLASVQTLSDTLDAQHSRRKEAVRTVVDQMLPQATSNNGNQAQLMQQFQIQINQNFEGARRETSEAMRAVEAAITPAQWQKLPPQIRNSGRQGGPGGNNGGGGGQGGGQGRGGGGFNAVGMIDRMLANPVPVILALKDSLKFTPEQVTEIEKVSADLQAKLTKRRETLGKRFDGVEQQRTGQVFIEIQPDLEAGRREITDALKLVEKALTKPQWELIPERIRNPMQQQQQGPGGRRGGGGGN
jgi:hypothetical protein